MPINIPSQVKMAQIYNNTSSKVILVLFVEKVVMLFFSYNRKWLSLTNYGCSLWQKFVGKMRGENNFNFFFFSPDTCQKRKDCIIDIFIFIFYIVLFDAKKKNNCLDYDEHVPDQCSISLLSVWLNGISQEWKLLAIFVS